MPKQVINVGTTVNDPTADPLRSAFVKVNQNFDLLFAQSASFSSTVPATSAGLPGDTAGVFAADRNFIYYCTQNYVDSITPIWVRSAWSADVW